MSKQSALGCRQLSGVGPVAEEGSHVQGTVQPCRPGPAPLLPAQQFVCLCIYSQDLDKVAGGDP